MSKEQRTKIDAMLRQWRPAGPQPVAAMRAGFSVMMAEMIVPAGIRTTETELGGRPALLVERAEGDGGRDAVGGAGVGHGSYGGGGPRAATILYFHGGGFVFGSPRTALSLTGSLVARTGFRAFSVDYRLAPEHPFPAAIDDTLNAYRALLDSGQDPSAIVFAGDSAGGGLAVTTALAARDAGLPLPAGILGFSAGLDATRTGRSMDTKAGVDPIFTREGLDHTGAMYVAGQDPHQPLLSPAVLADLTGFPPMLLQVGTNEMLLDDSTRLAARAEAAGVDVVLDVTAGVPHVFQAYTGVLDEADEALDRAALFLVQRVRAGGAGGADRVGAAGRAGRLALVTTG
ncbi:alpha/beta hydrolase [Streptomyces sp. NBC_01431]|uniref:alpha/beta hydrolase n=1 Tax=Streptomyces sp. NBC_01431 TaxID=2903863 RepID=UPI002E36BB0A|nr:alpha/beta hydrolase [Streptomyces sp. NBC_01431]